MVGQDLTVYGTDLYGKDSLVDLIDELESALPKNIWIRLLYLHPSRITKKLLERVASGKQVLPYLDIPIQHADPNILSAMNRKISSDELGAIFSAARSINEDFALRTTCMVGFPGEKKAHFDNLLDFVSKTRFDRMGAFAFFPEEGTEAEKMDEQVPETVKKRLNKLMAYRKRYLWRDSCSLKAELWTFLWRGSTGKPLLLREGVFAKRPKLTAW